MAPKNSPNVAAAAEAAKTLPAPPLNIEPTNLLPTSIARTYSHVHPVLVFGLFMSSFSALVFDPVTSLTTLLPPLAVLQAVYCILCLPPQHGEQLHGQSPQAHSNSNGNASSSRKKTGASIVRGSTLTSRVIPAILSLALTITITFPILTILVILHGGPLTTHHPQTLLLAAHLSLLATPPLFYTQGVSSERWRSLVSLAAAVDETRGAAIGALGGAWLGAIPIPLDWDREWQKWPVTVVAGVYAGWAVGKLLGGTVAKGKVIEFG